MTSKDDTCWAAAAVKVRSELSVYNMEMWELFFLAKDWTKRVEINQFIDMINACHCNTGARKVSYSTVLIVNENYYKWLLI